MGDAKRRMNKEEYGYSYAVFLDYSFPGENALSNYIENFCYLLNKIDDKAQILVAGIRPHHEIIDTKKPTPFDVEYLDTNGKGNRVKTSSLRKAIQKLDSNCIVFMYSGKMISVTTILLMARLKRLKVVSYYAEWFTRDYYAAGMKGILHYWGVELNFRFLRTLPRNAITVSTYIESFLLRKKVKVLRLPPMVDDDHIHKRKENRYTQKKLSFIYPGGDYKKDRIDNIVRAFSLLSDEDLERVEVHFSGIKKEIIEQLVDKSVIDRLKDVLIVHPWLDKNEYIDLLNAMDYCMILRDDNRITRANFPSKIPEVMNCGVIPIVSVVGDYTSLYLKDGVDSLFVNGSGAAEGKEVILRAMKMTHYERERMRENVEVCVKRHFKISRWCNETRVFIERVKAE